MSDLPWFKFFPSEWISGDIQLAPLELQGFFVNLCCFYWKKNGNLNINTLKARFPDIKEKISELSDLGVVKLNRKMIIIDFIDVQLGVMAEIHTKKVNAGKKGAKKRWQRHSNAKAELKQCHSSAIAEPEKCHSKPNGNKEEEGEVEEEREGEQDPCTPSKIKSIDRKWQGERLEKWATDLKRLGCKIGSNNWEHWDRLIKDHGTEAVHKTAGATNADQRWPDTIEKKLGPQLGSTVGMRRDKSGQVMV